MSNRPTPGVVDCRRVISVMGSVPSFLFYFFLARDVLGKQEKFWLLTEVVFVNLLALLNANPIHPLLSIIYIKKGLTWRI